MLKITAVMITLTTVNHTNANANTKGETIYTHNLNVNSLDLHSYSDLHPAR